MPTPVCGRGAGRIRGNGVLSLWQPARRLACVQMIRSTRALRGDLDQGAGSKGKE